MRNQLTRLWTRNRLAIRILLAVVTLYAVAIACGVGLAALNSQTTAAPALTTPAATPSATAAGSRLVCTQSGHGNGKTPVFHVAAPWLITFQCRGLPTLETTVFYINIYDASGAQEPDDIAYNCPRAGGGDTAIIQEGGDRFLRILALGDWTITIRDSP